MTPNDKAELVERVARAIRIAHRAPHPVNNPDDELLNNAWKPVARAAIAVVLEEAAKLAEPCEDLYDGGSRAPTDYEKQAYDLRSNIARSIRALNPKER